MATPAVHDFVTVAHCYAAAMKTLYEKSCADCGGEFVTAKRDRKYCSLQCSNVAKGKVNAARSIANRTRICGHCGQSFVMRFPSAAVLRGEKRAGLFCSADCRFTAARLATAREKLLWVLKGRRGCAACGGAMFSPFGGLTCSDECKAIYRRQWGRLYARALDARDMAPRPCGECGATFAPSATEKDGRRLFCSPDCARRNSVRVNKAARRARLKALPCEPVDPFKVFERDGWACHMCKAATPRELRGTNHDRAPELDHVQPLALGGPHTYANTACACRACNRIKGATLPTAEEIDTWRYIYDL